MEVKSAWWKSDKDLVHKSVFEHLRFLKENQNYKEEVNKRHMRIYGNMEVLGLNPNEYSRTNMPDNPTNLKLNVVQSVVDTLCSKIAKYKTKPMFLTEKGNYKLQKESKKLNLFTEGCYYDTDIYSKSRKVFLDGCVFNFGCFKFYELNGKIYAERVFPNEIKIDDREAWGGNVRQLHQVKYLHRDLLIDIFGKNSDMKYKISSAKAAATGLFGTNTSDVDLLEVAESWYLPDYSGKNGKWAVTIDEATLAFDVYDRKKFPFEFFRLNSRLLGFDGQGFVERLTPIQVEINKLLKTVQMSINLHGIPKILLDATTKIPEQHFDNDLGVVMKYIGNKPEIWAGRILHPEIFEQIDRLYNRAFELAGVTQLSASGQKPAGIEAAVALRELQDIETERFSITALEWEEFMGVKVARQFVELAESIYKKKGSFKVLSVGRKNVEEIDWKNIKIEESQYYLKPFPASQLPKTPAARQQWLLERFQAGLIDRDTYIDLSDFPDTENYNDLEKASRDIIREHIDLIVTDGEYNEPEKYMNLEFGLKYAMQSYNKALLDKVPDSNMDLLRRWIDSAIKIVNPAPIPQAQPIATPPTAPESEMMPYPTVGGENTEEVEQPMPEATGEEIMQ